ncbi:MAG: hypothetical protein GX220_08690 [Treponema sp.]|nr:hypothetical protein [Treponema sp.]
MKEQLLFPSDTQVFVLQLLSPFKSKRVLEAIEQLKNIYPFKVIPENIYIEKTQEKGTFKVFVSMKKIEVRTSNTKKIIGITFLAVVLLLLFSLGKLYMAKENEKKQVQVEMEKQQAEKMRLQKENETQLVALKKMYEFLMNSEYEIIYPILEQIYYCLSDKTTIETIAIEKNIFSIELTTKDALMLFKNFENSPYFTSVKMNRTTTVNEKELVSFTGTYIKYIELPRDDMSTTEKIYFYQEKITDIEKKKKAQGEIALSDYVKQIRTVLQKNHCDEQYIQLRTEAKNTEVECFVYSTSKNILSFLKEIQETDIPFYEIKKVKIKNNQNREKIQSTVTFASTLELKEQDITLNERKINSAVSSSELSRLFYKKPQQTVFVERSAEITKERPLDRRTFSKKVMYIGMTRVNGEVFVIVKDEEMNVLYKLPRVNNEVKTDYYIEKDGEGIAKIKSEYYKVVK